MAIPSCYTEEGKSFIGLAMSDLGVDASADFLAALIVRLLPKVKRGRQGEERKRERGREKDGGEDFGVSLSLPLVPTVLLELSAPRLTIESSCPPCGTVFYISSPTFVADTHCTRCIRW